jgi:hypothetical protein
MPCSPLKVDRCFGRTYHLNLQGRRISLARNQRGPGCKKCSRFLAWHIFFTLKWRQHVPSKRRLTFRRTTRRYIWGHVPAGVYRQQQVVTIKMSTYFTCARVRTALPSPYLAQPCSDRLTHGYVSHMIHLGHLARLRNSQHTFTRVSSHGNSMRCALVSPSPLHV